MSIRRLENKLFVVGVRKLTPCNGIRPCSKEVLALSLDGLSWRPVSVTAESTAMTRLIACLADLCLWDSSPSTQGPWVAEIGCAFRCTNLTSNKNDTARM